MKKYLTIARGVKIEIVRIPAGEFLMGSTDAEKDAQSPEKPQHNVTLDEYLIGKYDVTNAQFAAFAKATNRIWSAPFFKKNHPVADVTWDDAVAFCAWATQVTGRQVRLPTEAEWEKAARGADGRRYPWGNEWHDRTRCNSNFEVGGTTPVGMYSPAGDSPYGVADMAGNVWQYTSTLIKPYPYNATDGREDQSSRTARVLRGGGYILARGLVRSAGRVKDQPEYRYVHGFRVAASPI